jgi:hypothetical protein
MDTWAIKSDAQIAALPEELPRTLAPLTKYRNDITVLNGLTGRWRPRAWRRSRRPRPRGRELPDGAHPKKTFGKDLQAGVSMDQYAAGVIGSQTRFASLELGCEEGIQGGNCDNGYSCAYSNSISWRTPSTPNPPENSPARRLRAAVRRRRDRARSGEAREEREVPEERARFRSAGREASRAGRETSDRRKLDEYLYAVRDIETRIQKTESESALEPRDGSAVAERARELQRAHADHVRPDGDRRSRRTRRASSRS